MVVASAAARAAIREVRWTATEDGIQRANVSSEPVSRTARDLALVGLCWAASRIIAIYCLDSPVTLAFDEAQYLEESFLLSAGTPTIFYKGPFIYLLGAAALHLMPGRVVAFVIGCLMDLALVTGFWLAVRRDDRPVALTGALLLASCPLAAWFSMHLLSDVPLALFSFLCVYAWCRGDDARNRIEAAVWLCAALLVKSTAILLAPALILCAMILRRSPRALLAPLLAGAVVYLALPLAWSQTSDATFLKALPWMSFRCGLLYFPVVTFLAAGPVLTLGAAARVLVAKRSPAAAGAACALAVLAGTYTLFGDPQPKYIVTLAPFLALLAGECIARARPALIALCIVAAMIWIAPIVHLMEADAGMSAAAQYLRSLPVEAIHTTIPDGVHRHAFSGALRFAQGESPGKRLDDFAQATAPMAIWTDYSGNPDGLERALTASGRQWRRLDLYTNRNPRPIYLVGLDAPDPERLRWEPNILSSPLVTPLDLPLQAAKRMGRRWFQPSRNE